MEWRSKDHGVFPGIFHYKGSIGGNPGVGKLHRTLRLTQEDGALFGGLSGAMILKKEES